MISKAPIGLPTPRDGQALQIVARVGRVSALLSGGITGAVMTSDGQAHRLRLSSFSSEKQARRTSRQIQLRMGLANVHRWVPDILPLLTNDDPLGVDGFATHHLPLEEAPAAYAAFQKKADHVVKVVFHP